jgi:GNAT superfamily N-acetyltransferase
MGIRISAAAQQDAPVVLEMIRELAEYEKLSHVVTATEERIRKTLFGEHPAAEALLAYDGSAPAGFAVFYGTYSTFFAEPGLYLEDLYVKPGSRGRGIGYALLERLAAIAIERGCGRIEWHVLDWNTPSIRFYKKLGAESMEDWTKYRLRGEALKRLATPPSARAL